MELEDEEWYDEDWCNEWQYEYSYSPPQDDGNFIPSIAGERMRKHITRNLIHDKPYQGIEEVSCFEKDMYLQRKLFFENSKDAIKIFHHADARDAAKREQDRCWKCRISPGQDWEEHKRWRIRENEF